MAQSAPARSKIPTKSPQPARGKPTACPAGRARPPGSPPRVLRRAGPGARATRRRRRRSSSWSTASPVYPAREEQAAGGRSGTRTASGSSARRATEEKLAAKLEKVTERLAKPTRRT